MKKFFAIAAVAALALSACNTLETVETADDQKAISFEAFSHKSTKAVVVDKNNLDEFYVHGYYNAEVSIIHYFESTAKKNDTNDLWGTTPTVYYWPTDVVSGDKTMSFYAFKNIDNNKYSANLPTAKPVINGFEVAEGIADQKDAIVAKKEDTGYVESVEMKFNHILSRVDIKAKAVQINGLTTRYNISEVKIKGNNDGNGLKNKGNYKFEDNSWASLEGAVSYSLPVDGNLWNANEVASGADKGYQELTVVADNGSFMLIPQALDNIQIEVKYKVEVKSADDKWVSLFDGTRSADLKTATVEAWEPGKWYVYQLDIDAADLKPIQFSVEVTDWESAEAQTLSFE